MTRKMFGAIPLLLAALCFAVPTMAQLAGEPEAEEARVRVANLVYAQEKSSVCFAAGYLELLDRETKIPIDRKPVAVNVESETLFDFPFSVMSGEGNFTLTEAQVTNLRDYLTGGGFLLASAGCSNADWNTSFRREIRRVFPDLKLKEMPLTHEAFQMVFKITQFQTKTRGTKVQLHGLEIDGRMVLVYSPEGLNDTGNAGGGCCCCGGNEIRNAKYINANILAYALQR